MKFKFRLDILMRQRKAEQEVAQREYAEAQKKVRDQLARIESMYAEIDDARIRADNTQSSGGKCAEELLLIEEFIVGQKIKIERARHYARELMVVEEEKHEILIEKVKNYKILEKLKERRLEEHKKYLKKKDLKEAEDITIMKFKYAEDV